MHAYLLTYIHKYILTYVHALNTHVVSCTYIKYLHSQNVYNMLIIHRVSQKTVQNCFCQNLVKFISILIIFGRQMTKWLELYAIYTFSTSRHSCHSTTLLNTKILNFYITLKICSCTEIHLTKPGVKVNGTYYIATIFVPRSYCKTYFGFPRVGLCLSA